MGNWNKNCFDGLGTMKWPDGTSFEGTYKMNQYVKGRYTNKSGKVKNVNYASNV